MFKTSRFAVALLFVFCTSFAPGAMAGDQPARITPVSQAFKMDGDAAAWAAIPSVPVAGTAGDIGRLKLACDNDSFYALFTVPDASPLKNATSLNDPAMMLKGGDAVGLAFGPADGKGMPQRILFSLLDGQPVAVVYRPVSLEKKPYTFESPVGKVTFDYVAKLPEAQVVFKLIPGGYIAEIRIPWSVLGLAPREGLEFPFDAQVILSDGAGQKNVGTGWWHSTGAGPLCFIDLPTEAQLYPDEWGKAQLAGVSAPVSSAAVKLPAQAVSPAASTSAGGPIPIHFTLPRAAKVSLEITDKKGWILRELCVATPFPAGESVVTWDGRDEYGDPLPEGSYQWKLAYFDGVGSKRIGGAGNSARPPFRTKDGKGDLSAIHGMAAALASDAGGIYHLGGCEEGNPGLTKLSADGFAIWKRSLGGFGTGAAMAVTDRFAAMIVHATGKTLLITMDPKTGKDAPSGSAGARFPLGDIKLNVAGLAICGNKAYFGLPDSNQVGVLDLATGERAPEITVPSPRDVRSFDDTHLLVTSGNQVLKVDPSTGQSTVFLANLKEPHAIARDASGNIYVSEWGDSQQIVKFSSAGKEIGRFGTAGGRPATCIPYDPRMLHDVKSLAIGPDGNLWFMEDSSLRRVGVMTTAGQWQKDIFQTLPSQAGAGVDLDDPSRVFFHMGYDSMVEEARIDFAANAKDPANPDAYWKLENTYMMTLAGDYTPPAPDDMAAFSTKSCFQDPVAFTGTNGKHYLWEEGPVASLWIESGGRLKPVQVIGGDGVDKGTLFPKGKSFSWSDANGDGKPQADEIDLDTTTKDLWRWIDRDLTLYGAGGKLKPYKVDGQGVPYYHRSDWIPDITAGKPPEFYYRDRSYSIFPSPPAPDGARYDVFNFGAGQQRSFWDRCVYSRIARVKDGRIQWMAGKHDGTQKTPGSATYLWRPLGEVDGVVIVGDVDFQLIAYTSDGFGLGSVTPPHSVQMRDQPPESIVQENVQSGHFVKDPKTGKSIVIIGSGTEAFILEILGIDPKGIQRMQGTVQLGNTPPLTPETPGQYSLLYRTWPNVHNGRYFGVTGDGWGWRPEIPWITINDGPKHVAEVRLRRDDGALHIYANIFDPAPFAAESPAVTAGDVGKIQGLEVFIGPATPETRTAPVAGDTHFFLTAQRKNGNLIGVLLAMRPASGGPDAQTFVPVPGVKVAARDSLNGYGYHLEAEIPLTFLPELTTEREVTYIRNYQPGAKLKGDFNETYTQTKPDITNAVRLNIAVWQGSSGGLRRIPWMQAGEKDAAAQAMNPSRWGVATSEN